MLLYIHLTLESPHPPGQCTLLVITPPSCLMNHLTLLANVRYLVITPTLLANESPHPPGPCTLLVITLPSWPIYLTLESLHPPGQCTLLIITSPSWLMNHPTLLANKSHYRPGPCTLPCNNPTFLANIHYLGITPPRGPYATLERFFCCCRAL